MYAQLEEAWYDMSNPILHKELVGAVQVISVHMQPGSYKGEN